MRNYWQNIKRFNRNIRYFLTASAIHGFVFFGISNLLLNLYLLRLGYGPEFIGLVNGVGPVMLAVMSLPAGLISRRIGSRRILIASYIGMTVGFFLIPTTGALPEAMRQSWLLIINGLMWTFGAFAVVNFSPYLMAMTGEKERSYAFSIQSASFPVAGFLGNLLGGQLPGLFARFGNVSLDSAIPYRNALFVAAFIELIAVVAIWQIAEATPVVTSSGPQQKQRSRPPYRLILLFSAVSAFVIAGEWTMRIYFNVYLDSELSVPTSMIGVLSAGALVMGLLALVSPKAAALWGRNRVIQIGLVGAALAFVPLIAVPHWLAVGVSYMILVGVVSLMNPTYLVFSQSAVDPQWRTTIASGISMSMGIGIALPAFGGGTLVASVGYQMLFILGGLAALVAAGLFWFGFQFRQRSSPTLATNDL